MILHSLVCGRINLIFLLFCRNILYPNFWLWLIFYLFFFTCVIVVFCLLTKHFICRTGPKFSVVKLMQSYISHTFLKLNRTMTVGHLKVVRWDPPWQHSTDRAPDDWRVIHVPAACLKWFNDPLEAGTTTKDKEETRVR